MLMINFRLKKLGMSLPTQKNRKLFRKFWKLRAKGYFDNNLEN